MVTVGRLFIVDTTGTVVTCVGDGDGIVAGVDEDVIDDVAGDGGGDIDGDIDGDVAGIVGDITFDGFAWMGPELTWCDEEDVFCVFKLSLIIDLTPGLYTLKDVFQVCSVIL